MYLNELPVASSTDDGRAFNIRVGGVSFVRSLGVQQPSSLVYDIGGRYDLLTCRVALNDSAFGPDRYPTATFQVLADGVVAAQVSNVHTARPRSLIASIQGAQRLELRVNSPAADCCHAVWLDPKVDVWPKDGLLDPLGQVRIYKPKAPVGKVYRVRFEDYGVFEDWQLYRPQRIFTELTGMAATMEDVSPALYHDTAPRDKRLVVCDQAGWKNRRGYPYLNSLLAQLRDGGWEIIYLRNTNVSERQVRCEHVMLKLSLVETIELLKTASLFVGYDSGLAHIAAGLHVPSVQFAGATPPRVFVHRNCIYCLEACNHCCTDQCLRNCLTACGDQNAKILTAIAAHFKEPV